MAVQQQVPSSNAVRDLLLGEDTSQQAEFILNLIAEAAEGGREILNVISDVIQVGVWLVNGRQAQ